MIFVFAFISFVTSVVVLRGGLYLVRWYQLRYAAYTASANEFYAAAERLAENPNTPEDVLVFINELNEAINFPHTAMIFVRIMQKRRATQPSRGSQPGRFDVRQLPPEVLPDFVIVVESWTEAVACRGMASGLLFKAYLDRPSLGRASPVVAARIHDKRSVALAH